MKHYDIETYRLHLKEVPTKCKDPFTIECYMKGALDLALQFNTEETASGILSKNDIIQECYYILCKAWGNIDWDAIRASDEPQANIWAYLKKTIKLDVRNRIHDQKDGIRIPHGKRWELQETKNVDDFLTQLFPIEYFTENDERMGLYEESLVRYDIEQLGIAFEDVMSRYLSNKEQMILEHMFGVDREKLSVKDIASKLNISESNVKKTKFIAIQKLKNEDVRNYLEDFYTF